MMTRIQKLFNRFYSPRYMLKESLVKGELPSSKEVYGETFHLAWPVTFESVLVGFVTIIDTIMVSVLGTDAIAAVGITNQPRMIVLSIFMALNVGVTAVVAWRKGQNRKEDANKCLRQSLFITFFLSIIITGITMLFSRPFLEFAGAGPDIIDEAVTFFFWILVGIPFNVLSLTITAAQRGAGNTKISMVVNVTANVINIILNYLLITGQFGFPRLGVAGSAIGTTIGIIVGFLIACLSLRKSERFLYICRGDSYIPERETMNSIVKVGISAAVEQLFMRIGFFIYAKIVAELGTVAFATHQICMNMLSLSYTLGEGLSIAAATLVGQNMGKNRPDRALIYGKACQRIAVTISVFLFAIFFFGGNFFMSLFTADPAIITMGAQLFIVMAFIAPAQTSQVVFNGSLRGAGDTRFVAIISFISIGIVRPLTSLILCYPLGFGLIGAWLGMLIDQYVRYGFSYARFNIGKWFNATI